MYPGQMNMIGWRQYHFIIFCKYQGLQHIDRLGNIGHLHPFTMIIEYVKR